MTLGAPDGKFGLKDPDGNEPVKTGDDRIRDLNAALRALGAGSIPFDAVSIINSSGAGAIFRDSDAGAGLKNWRWLTLDGVTYGQTMSDNYSSATTRIAIDHAAGTITIPDGKLVAKPPAWTLINSGGVHAANSWTADSSVFVPSGSQVYADGRYYVFNGYLYLDGWMRRTSNSTAAPLTFDSGYRPSCSQYREAKTGVGRQELAFHPDGTMAVLGTTTDAIFLGGISFRVDA